MTSTDRFIGPPAGWAACRIALADVHGLWGGHALGLHGTGMGWATTVARGGGERRVDIALPPAAVDALFRLIIAHDFLALAYPPRPGVADEARPVVSVTNPAGETRAIAKWANDRSPDFEVVHAALLDLIRDAAGA